MSERVTKTCYSQGVWWQFEATGLKQIDIDAVVDKFRNRTERYPKMVEDASISVPMWSLVPEEIPCPNGNTIPMHPHIEVIFKKYNPEEKNE